MIDDIEDDDDWASSNNIERTLLSQVLRMYGPPATCDSPNETLRAERLMFASAGLGKEKPPNTKMKAWGYLNTAYFIDGKKATYPITETIVSRLESAFTHHKYFATRKPSIDDFQEVLLIVLERLQEYKETDRETVHLQIDTAVKWTIKDHLKRIIRLERRGLGEDKQTTMLDLSILDAEAMEDFMKLNSPETPYEAYEKAQMAAW